MSENSAIEWTDHTFNPWEGCQKVGPGCDHCYAETRNARFAGGTAINWGPGAPRRRTSVSNWNKPLAWNRAHDEFFAKHGRRQCVFCASLADVFDNAVDLQWRRDLLKLIESTPNLDWLLLTKRIGNVLGMVPEGWFECNRHVMLGATIISQEEADRDIPKLLAVPAARRFLSMEPLLGPVDLLATPAGDILCRCEGCMTMTPHTRLDWVIVGGESGPGARPMHPEWAFELRDQCAAAGVPFLFKQWGEWTPGENVTRVTGTVETAFLNFDGASWRVRPLDLQTDGGHIDDEPDLYRVGKKEAGRLLDGVQHDGYPVAL
jgi:protein gp37